MFLWKIAFIACLCLHCLSISVNVDLLVALQWSLELSVAQRHVLEEVPIFIPDFFKPILKYVSMITWSPGCLIRTDSNKHGLCHSVASFNCWMERVIVPNILHSHFLFHASFSAARMPKLNKCWVLGKPSALSPWVMTHTSSPQRMTALLCTHWTKTKMIQFVIQCIQLEIERGRGWKLKQVPRNMHKSPDVICFQQM